MVVQSVAKTGLVAQSKFPMNSQLICINEACRARYAMTEVIYNLSEMRRLAGGRVRRAAYRSRGAEKDLARTAHVQSSSRSKRCLALSRDVAV